MNFKSLIAASISVAICAIIPATASAAVCASPSVNVATEQATVTIGQTVTYSYSFCYASSADHYTVQVIQTENAAGESISQAVTPAEVTELNGQPGSASSGGSFVPQAAGRYKVIVAYYELGQKEWESEGEALIIAKAASVVPPAQTTPIANPSIEIPSLATPAPKNNPSATPIGTASPTTHITLTKQALRKRVQAGHTVSFKLTVKDALTATATNVRVCDTLPAQTQYVGASKQAVFHGETACFSLGNIPAGKSISFTISLSINQGTHGKVINHATATASDASTAHAQAKVIIPSAKARKAVARVTG